ncbi:hypothetical protein HDU83_005926, partial [Entophlyctis luteolus]
NPNNLSPSGFPHPSARTHVKLLGPCFKTGRMGNPLADATVRRCCEQPAPRGAPHEPQHVRKSTVAHVPSARRGAGVLVEGGRAVSAANEYNPKLRATEIAASLKGYYKETKALKTPGPANYVTPSSLFAAGPQYSLAARNDFDDADDFPDAPPRHRVHGPSPTSYDPRPVFDASPKNSLGARWKVFPRKEQ